MRGIPVLGVQVGAAGPAKFGTEYRTRRLVDPLHVRFSHALPHPFDQRQHDRRQSPHPTPLRRTVNGEAHSRQNVLFPVIGDVIGEPAGHQVKAKAKALKTAPQRAVQPTTEPSGEPTVEPPTEPAPEPESTTEPPAAVQASTLRITGTVPPEVWNRLGVKFLSKLRSGEDLTVGVNFTVKFPPDTLQTVEADLRQVLADLGLAAQVTIERAR